MKMTSKLQHAVSTRTGTYQAKGRVAVGVLLSPTTFSSLNK